MQNHASTLAAEFKLDAARVAATVALIDEGNTIPFIARYRKEATGSMDDQTLRALDERLSYLRKLDDQKETVHNSITEQGAMTPEIAAALEKAKTLAEVEDIYRPYKPKRKTRASIARARGLEPLAARLLEQRPEDEPALLARQYITEEVPDTEAALAGAKNPLDATAVHPESYGAAEKLLALCGLSPADIGTPAARELEQQAKRLGHGKLAAELGVGVPTLEDMIEELLRPGRDMRDSLPKPLLRTDVLDMKDLTPGMQLTGTVRNVIDFGAFVDIGVHQDGLVHISQISSRFIRHPSEVLKVGDVVTVWVLSVDLQKKRIALTMKQPKTEQAH